MTETFSLPQEARTDTLDDVEAACLTAVFNSMRINRRAQRLSGFVLQASEIKADGSLLTATDLDSEQTAQRVFREMLPHAAFTSEEGAHTKGSSNSRRIAC